MRERFGKEGADGLIDYHWNRQTEEYDRDYVNPTRWTVDFDACGTVPSPTTTSGSFQYRRNSAAQRIDHLQFRKTREVAIAGGQCGTVFNCECGQMGIHDQRPRGLPGLE